MQYKGALKSAAQVAHELGVDYVLEGSVRWNEQRVRVTAQLIQASDQTHLWAADFDRDPGDVLRLQSDLALAISSKIELTLSPPVRARLTKRRRSMLLPTMHTCWGFTVGPADEIRRRAVDLGFRMPLRLTLNMLRPMPRLLARIAWHL